MGTTLDSKLFGSLPIRPESARMMADFGKALSLLVDAEVEEDLANPAHPKLTKEELAVRERLIQTVADTKATARALREVLGDRSTWMMPHLSVSRTKHAAHAAGEGPALEIFACENIENNTLNSVLRWVLNNASDAPYARYQFVIEEIHNFHEPEVIEASHTIVTREKDYQFDNTESCNEASAELDRAWAGQQCAGGLPHDPSSNVWPAGPGGV